LVAVLVFLALGTLLMTLNFARARDGVSSSRSVE
jgi:cell division protein FtsX